MTRIGWTWLGLAIVYAIFFIWYTSFGGPLTEAEIEGYLDRFEARNPPPSEDMLETLRRFMEEDTGDDFVMINVIDLYETPVAMEGLEAGATGSDALGEYMAYMYPALFSRASHPVLFGQAAAPAMDLMNAPGMSSWTQGAGMRYRSRRDMLEIATNPAFAGAHAFKIAAMKKTIAFPIDPWLSLGDPRLILALLLGLAGALVSWRLSARRS
ncbi:MAG: hypothetical protein AB7I04_00255 [Pseudomonadales bacterium]